MKKHIVNLWPLAVLGLSLAMMGVGHTMAPDTPEQKVTILDYKFEPATLTVPVGTRVIWMNRDDDPHSIVSDDRQFDSSRALDSGGSYAVTFDKPGTYVYHCSLHPFMTGKIVVTSTEAAEWKSY